MRIQISRSVDYNQMLVISLFVHLVALTVAMFLPKPKILPKLVLPAFEIELVDFLPEKKSFPKTGPTQKPGSKPRVRKPQKKVPAPKRSQPRTKKPDVAKKLIRELDKLGGKSKTVAPVKPRPKLVEELDQLAKLAPSLATHAEPPKSSPVLDKSLMELETLKTQKTPPIPSKQGGSRPVLDPSLKELETLKSKKVPPVKSKREKKSPVLERSLKELESLKSEKHVPVQPKVRKGPQVLDQTFKDLEQLKSRKPEWVPPRESKKAMLDETFNNLENLKKRKWEPKEKPVLVPHVPEEDPLKGFSDLKMVEDSANGPGPEKKTGKPGKHLSAEEEEFENLAKKKIRVKEAVEDDPTRKLLAELEHLAKLKTAKTVQTRVKKGQKPTSIKKQDHEVLIRPALKKLESLKVPARNIEIAVVAGNKEEKAFSSMLRKIETPKITSPAKEPKKPSEIKRPASGNESGPQAVLKTAKGPSRTDVLSHYVGVIKKKILANWKNPLGAEHNEVLASFYIYPKGNIGKPVLEKSSDEEQLDNLAVQAILDSEPFPKFPKGLKEPNLHITIRFKYVYQEE